MAATLHGQAGRASGAAESDHPPADWCAEYSECSQFAWRRAIEFPVDFHPKLVRDETERLFYRVARTAAEYRALLENLPAALDRFRPQLVQYQAGVDCHEHDPVGGITGVDATLLLDRDRFVIEEVVSRRIPLVVNLAGGYQPGGVSERLHVQTVRLAAARGSR